MRASLPFLPPSPRRRQSQCTRGGGRSGSRAPVLLGALPDGCGPGGLLLRGATSPRGALPDAQPPARRGAAQPAAVQPSSPGLARRRGLRAAPGRLHLGALAQAPPPGGGPAPDQSRGRGRGPAAPEQRAPAAARRVPAPRRRAVRAGAPGGARGGPFRQPGPLGPRLGFAMGVGGGPRARRTARCPFAPRQPGRGPPGEGTVHPRRAGRHPRPPRPRGAPQSAPTDPRPQRGAVPTPGASPGRGPPRTHDRGFRPPGLAQGSQGRSLPVRDQPFGPRRRGSSGSPQVPYSRKRRASAATAPPWSSAHSRGSGRGVLPPLALHGRDRRCRWAPRPAPRSRCPRPGSWPIPVSSSAPFALWLRGKRLGVLGRAPGAPRTPGPDRRRRRRRRLRGE